MSFGLLIGTMGGSGSLLPEVGERTPFDTLELVSQVPAEAARSLTIHLELISGCMDVLRPKSPIMVF